jgi:hypothetical protein
MTMLHGPPETGPGAPRGSAADSGSRRCPECLGPVDTAKEWRKMFCCDEHRQAFHNRQLKRGRSLVVPAIAERITRSGYCRRKAAGIRARQRNRRMMDDWIKEDRAANRMPMDEYFELTDRLGFYDD